MAPPKRRKPRKREPEQPAAESPFTAKQKKDLYDLYQTMRKVVRKRQKKT